MNQEPERVETSYEFACRLFAEGVREFESGGYFEAHDLWEEFWQELRGPDRVFVQGLIHLAVGVYHHGNDNMNGAMSQLGKAATKLSQYPPGHWGISAERWIQWARQIAAGQPSPRPDTGLGFEPSRFPRQISMAPR